MTVRERLAEWLRPTEQKAATGIGASWMTHQPQLSTFLKDPRKAMAQAQEVGRSNLYIRAAERVIGERFSTVGWHLEDANDEPIESGPIVDLMERPYRPQPGDPIAATPQTRAGLWRITCRHMGLCGNAFWYLDRADALAGTPLSLLYINPARMTPSEDDAGNLIGWVLDADAYGKGMPLEPKSVLHFRLEPADTGHWGMGLVESAYERHELLRLADRQAQGILAAGGRLAGVFAPPDAASAIPEEQYQQLVKDIRTITELPDAARRSLVLRGPIEFTKTAASPSELDLRAMSELGRDGILDLWGVPLSQLAGQGPGGLNSGETHKYDEASLWQNAIGPRLRSFAETVQFGLLDRFAALGQAVELEIEEPAFDDEAPMYDLAQKAAGLPLTNRERREMVGLEPLGDPEFDEAVWLPINLTDVWTVGKGAPEPPAPAVPFMPMQRDEAPPEEEPEEEAAEDEDSPVKAILDAAKARAVPGQDRLRAQTTRGMERALERVFARMQAEVSAKVKRNAAHLASHPNDDSVWWDEAKWQREITNAIRPPALNAAAATVDKVEAMLA